MAKSEQENKLPSPLGHHVGRGIREGLLFLLLAVAIYLLAALLSYHPNDPGWSYSGSGQPVQNLGGLAGAWFADVFLYLFGYMAYLFPVMIACAGILVWRWQRQDGQIHWAVFGFRGLGFALTLISGAAIAALHVDALPQSVPLHAGGILGDVVGGLLNHMFSFLGATLLLLAVFLASVTLFTGLSWVSLIDLVGRLTLQAGGMVMALGGRFRDVMEGRRARRARTITLERDREKSKTRKPPQIEPTLPPLKAGRKVHKERQIPLFKSEASPEGLPPVSLLDAPPAQQSGYSKEALEAMSRQLELKLADFGVEIQVVAVQPGPVITRFEAQPAPGVKVSQISNLAKDLARALSVISVRVVEVIPGKSVIGLEIPNENRQLIAFSEIVRSEAWERASSPLSMALGKDIAGAPTVVDLAKMPHLLVAGTTGSGKSVGVNAMILSLLYKNKPDDVRLIMIDPKMLELSIYDGIPHLLAPVVTDMKEAGNALRWCVGEMERRYRLMAALGVRNIAGYNRKVKDAIAGGEPLKDPLWRPSELEPDVEEAPELEVLPYVVVVVDEFADMMMIVGKKVEELIARLAQKARAAGLHLILATQRPSVDVITGLIKANIPTRIAFQVSSKVDSRTILDQQGAEALLGHGDMLYLAPGTGLPNRVHGAFVSDNDVHKVVAYLKEQGEPQYIDGVLEETSDSMPLPGIPGEGGGDGESDPLYDQAVRVVTETRRASISGVQRRLKIGYNRAARLVEEMETAGIVGPLQANGSREVIAPPPPKD